ncbi:plasmid maintenance system antidote protein VapI [Bacillus thermophilus]|uniref:Plasmid maintenance system antidote protein VapI n=1 Tax=Siminovitchia thermophila TaxID=1245522 RepID=A0ABS2RFP9_9BACI|nr:HTH domain-containing protein [Siminovitchia thermophila]MBM7717688.1 plasmid maintenance system antidote protein VapI [Siminovitchia thermophila]
MSTKGTNSFKKEIQDLVNKYDLEFKQISKLLNIPLDKLNNMLNHKVGITDHEEEKIENKLAMLNHGFSSGIEAKERVQIILDNLIDQFELSISNISKIINVEEKELLNFKENKPVPKEIELNIAVNTIMLNFVLNQT